MAKEPFDILANTTWLPAGPGTVNGKLYWTPRRAARRS